MLSLSFTFPKSAILIILASSYCFIKILFGEVMAEITASAVKALREKTGAGMSDACGRRFSGELYRG